MATDWELKRSRHALGQRLESACQTRDCPSPPRRSPTSSEPHRLPGGARSRLARRTNVPSPHRLPRCAQAREEYEGAGGDNVFGSVDRHKTFLGPETINKAYAVLQQQFLEHPQGLEQALLVVGANRGFGQEEKQRSGSHKTVDEFHLFLLVFMYVHGGAQQFMAPFLPGVKVSQGHFSRLLVNSTPVVVQTWRASTIVFAHCCGWLRTPVPQ